MARKEVGMKRYLLRILKAIAQLLSYTYCGLLIAYFILRVLFWDRLWIVAFLSSLIPWLFFPIFLLPLVGFISLKQKWFSIGSSIACLILIGWLHHHYFYPESAQLKSNNYDALTIKFLSLNATWYHTTKEALGELIYREIPDIICLQETVSENTKKLFPYIQSSYPYNFFSPHLAIFSRYPIEAKNKINLANHQEFQQRVIVNIKQQPVVLYNMQTTAPWIRPQKILPWLTIPVYQYSDRTAEIADFMQRIETETLPVIAAGDFNFTDQSQDYDLVASGLKDAFKISGLGFGFTWPHGWPLSDLIKVTNWKLTVPLFRIDYIWYSPDWQSHSSQVLKPVGSEHLPITTQITLLTPRETWKKS